MNLSRHLFWDTEYNAIDWEKHRRFVIQRVFSKGTIQDWKLVKAYYGMEEVKKVLIRERYLDKKTLNFSSFYFRIPKEDFRCYKSSLSGQKPWIY